MNDKIYKEENTLVFEIAGAVSNLPIVDTFFYINYTSNTYVLRGVNTGKTVNIKIQDVIDGKIEDDSLVAYTESSLNTFLRRYASLTGISIP